MSATRGPPALHPRCRRGKGGRWSPKLSITWLTVAPPFSPQLGWIPASVMKATRDHVDDVRNGGW